MGTRIIALVLVACAAVSYLEYRRAAPAYAQPASVAAPITSDIAPQVSSNPREQFALDVLRGVGNDQPTPQIVAFLVEWTIAEDGGDGAFNRNNPLNTTQPSTAETGSINDDGVRAYATYQDGLDATLHTLTNGFYDGVVVALQSNNPDAARTALWASPWAASHYGGGAGWPHVDAPEQAPASGAKCPYTDTMQIADGSSFYSTGSPYWSGQYGGMHLGDDFVGNPGDPVYAPFAMQVEMIGRYNDPGRFGAYIQARFQDGTLFYAGHLIDVYVSGGQSVPPCTVIGTLGATAGPHTHIKLGASGAPVPCEGAQPGAGGCLDPLEYWETH